MVVPSLSDEVAKEKFGKFDVVSVPSGKPYIRMTVMPLPVLIGALNLVYCRMILHLGLPDDSNYKFNKPEPKI